MSEPLKLVTEKRIDPRRPLIDTYIQRCKKEQGFCNEEWAIAMRAMHTRFASLVDESEHFT